MTQGNMPEEQAAEVASEYSSQRICTSLDCDGGVGVNAGTSVAKIFVETDPLSELVWSPMKGLCVRCADGRDSREKTYLKWVSGQRKIALTSTSVRALAITKEPERDPFAKVIFDTRGEERSKDESQSVRKRRIRNFPGSRGSRVPQHQSTATSHATSGKITSDPEIPASNGKGKGRAFSEDDNSNESVESCVRADLHHEGKDPEPYVIAETRKVKNTRQCSPPSSFNRPPGSFMMWVSNMFKELPSTSRSKIGGDMKSLLGSDIAPRSTRFGPVRNSKFKGKEHVPEHDDKETESTATLFASSENDGRIPKRLKRTHEAESSAGRVAGGYRNLVDIIREKRTISKVNVADKDEHYTSTWIAHFVPVLYQPERDPSKQEPLLPSEKTSLKQSVSLLPTPDAKMQLPVAKEESPDDSAEPRSIVGADKSLPAQHDPGSSPERKMAITSIPPLRARPPPDRNTHCVPPFFFDGVKKLQISRAAILKWIQSQMPLSNLDGFFLRLRLAKWEAGLSGTRYLVAIVSGVHRQLAEENKVSIGVDVGGTKCLVECQYISNQLIREDELVAWWSSTSQRGGHMPSEEELRLKFERKKWLGF